MCLLSSKVLIWNSHFWWFKNIQWSICRLLPWTCKFWKHRCIQHTYSYPWRWRWRERERYIYIYNYIYYIYIYIIYIYIYIIYTYTYIYMIVPYNLLWNQISSILCGTFKFMDSTWDIPPPLSRGSSPFWMPCISASRPDYGDWVRTLVPSPVGSWGLSSNNPLCSKVDCQFNLKTTHYGIFFSDSITMLESCCWVTSSRVNNWPQAVWSKCHFECVL